MLDYDTISLPLSLRQFHPQGLGAFHNIGLSKSRWVGWLLVQYLHLTTFANVSQNCSKLEIVLSSPAYCLKHKLTKSIRVAETLLTCHVPMYGFVIISKAYTWNIYFGYEFSCLLNGYVILCWKRLAIVKRLWADYLYPHEMRIKPTSTTLGYLLFRRYGRKFVVIGLRPNRSSTCW